MPWHFEEGEIMNVNIVNADNDSLRKIAVIKDVILFKKMV